MVSRIAAILAPWALVFAAPASAAPPTPATPSISFAPAGKWTVEFADQQCLASREFAAPGQRLTLALQFPILASDSASFYLFLPNEQQQFWKGLKLVVPGAPGFARQLPDRLTPDGKTIIVSRHLAEGGLTALPAAGRIELTNSVGDTATIPLDMLPRVRPILADCERDLLAAKGIPAETIAVVATWPRAKANLASYVADNDYPAEAIRRNEQGQVSYMLKVSAKGRVSDCRIVASSGSTSLDKKTCEVMVDRALFEPAVDKAGKPIEAFAEGRIRWSLPK